MVYCQNQWSVLTVNCRASLGKTDISGTVLGTVRSLRRKEASSAILRCRTTKALFLEGTHLSVWQIVLFCNHWLQNVWDHQTIFECLKWSEYTSVDWCSFWSEVTLDWLRKQEPIGDDGVVVEIDETFFC